MMKKMYIMLMLCAMVCTAQAQLLTRNYRGETLSHVLEDLNAATGNYEIAFVYNDLEYFTVTCSFSRVSLDEALRRVVGFYPVRILKDGEKIFVECTQKTERHLTGTVIDENGHPLPFANISVLNPVDSLALGGGVSNEAGQFVVPYNQHKIIARVSYVGYKTVYRTCTTENMGTIRMQPDTYTLQAVVVKGEIPQYKMTSGGMTVDVEHSILHDVGSASDLLPMLPLVQNNDGKITVMSKGEPEIYINNKKVTNTNELKQLKSVDIKNVDIITAPGAKYNAEVNAVIRIKTIKTQGDGFSVMATSQTWKNNKWNNYSDVTLKYRTGGFETFANVALDNGHYSYDQYLEQELHISKDLFNGDAELPVRSSWTELKYRAGVSYDFNTDHSVGLSFSSQKILGNSFKTEMKQHYLKNGAFYGDVDLKTNIHEQDKPVWELNTYYVGKAGKLGIDLNATVLRRESDVNNSQYELSEELGDRAITTQTQEKSTMIAGKLVLSYPIWKGELNAGTEAISTQSHGHNLNHEGIIPESDNEMKEKNIAGFAEYELQIGNWRFDAGLRYEHVSTNYKSFGVYQEEPSRTYNDLFPNFSVAWKKGKWGAQLSYSKRVTRPPYSMLTSLIIYDSRMLYEGGNPLLRPSVRQSIDFNLIYSWLNFVAGFTRENDFFTHIGEVYDEEKEIAIFRPNNFNHQDRVYATIVASPKFGFWQPSLTLHYYQQMFDTEKYGVGKKLNKPEFSVNLQSWFTINPTTKAMFYIGYTGSNHWGFMYRGSDFTTNARIQKSFCNGRLNATLYANDIFRTSKNKITTYYAIGKTAQDIYNYTQCVGLTLSYNFNVSGSRYKGTGAGNEEKSRL